MTRCMFVRSVKKHLKPNEVLVLQDQNFGNAEPASQVRWLWSCDFWLFRRYQTIGFRRGTFVEIGILKLDKEFHSFLRVMS